MKHSIIIAILLLSSIGVNAQKHFTKTGTITFHSDAPLETIEAVNSKATSVVDLESGAIQWAVLVKAFKFEKALMEEHFNENYMESSKFPKATFKGQLENYESIQLDKDGVYESKITGSLTIHGVSNEIESTVTFTVDQGNVMASSAIDVVLEDYKIAIPNVVAGKISETVQVTIEANYQPLNK